MDSKGGGSLGGFTVQKTGRGETQCGGTISDVF